MITTTAQDQILGYGPITAYQAPAPSAGMLTLMKLDAARMLIIYNMETNRPYADFIAEDYNRDCKAAGIDPETWEGLR